MYNYSKLLGAIRENGYTQDQLAVRIGVHPATLNQKLNNSSQFKQDEILLICKTLSINIDKIDVYFFCKFTCENAS